MNLQNNIASFWFDEAAAWFQINEEYQAQNVTKKPSSNMSLKDYVNNNKE